MTIVQTTNPIQVFDDGSELKYLLDIQVGETVEYSDTILNRSEYSDITATVTGIMNSGVSVNRQNIGIPEFNSNGDRNPDYDLLVAGLSLPLVDIDFDNPIGTVSTTEYFSIGISGSSTSQPNGVRQINSNNSYVMRPDLTAKQNTYLETYPFNISGTSSVDIQLEISNLGQMESDDTFTIELDVDGTVAYFAEYTGDILSTTHSENVSVPTGDYAILRLISFCGEGNLEAHVVNSIVIS